MSTIEKIQWDLAVAIQVRDLAREASNRDLEAKRTAEQENFALRAEVRQLRSTLAAYSRDTADYARTLTAIRELLPVIQGGLAADRRWNYAEPLKRAEFALDQLEGLVRASAPEVGGTAARQGETGVEV